MTPQTRIRCDQAHSSDTDTGFRDVKGCVQGHMHRVRAHDLTSDPAAALRPSLRGRSGESSCMDSTGMEEEQWPGGESAWPVGGLQGLVQGLHGAVYS